jgi:hypothetical protein
MIAKNDKKKLHKKTMYVKIIEKVREKINAKNCNIRNDDIIDYITKYNNK